MKKFLLLTTVVSFAVCYFANAQGVDTATSRINDTASRQSLNLTGSMSEIHLKHIRPDASDVPEYNFSKILSGLMTGMQTTNGSGQPGSSSDIALRGLSGLIESNAPLIILDGIPYYGDYNGINVNDIKSVTILKDAQSTFQFGNRARNGIIVITTGDKTSRAHKKILEVNAQFGTSTPALQGYKTLGLKDYIETLNGALQNAGQPYNLVDFMGGYNPYNVPSDQIIGSDGRLNPNAKVSNQDHWRDELNRIGIRQNYNVAASDNGDKGAYYLSAGYVNDKGFVQQTDYERFAARFNGNLNITKWFTAGIRSQAAIGNQHYAYEGKGGLNPFYESQLMAPEFPVYYRNLNGEKEIDPSNGKNKFDWGSLTQFPNSSIGNRTFYSGTNAIASLYRNDFVTKMNAFLVNPYLSIKFLNDFIYTADFNYNFNTTKDAQHFDDTYGTFTGISGAYNKFDNQLTGLNFRQRLTWNRNFDDIHHIQITIGNDYLNQHTIDSIVTYNPPAQSYDVSNIKNHSLSYYTRASYDFKEKYYLSAGLRKDQWQNNTSNKWESNWMLGAIYKISNENFMKNIDWISELKLKANYGTQGHSLFYGSSYYPANNPNGDVSTNKQLSGGMEARFSHNNIYLELVGYHRNTSGVIGFPVLAFPNFTTGFAPVSYSNTGLEFSLYTTNISNRHFIWSTTFLLSHNNNKIANMPKGIDQLISGDFIYKKGESVASYYLPEYAGVDPDDGNALYYSRDANGNKITSTTPPQQSSDFKRAGSAFPVAFGSLTNHFDLGEWEFSFQVNYSLGGQYYDQIYQDLMGPYTNASNWSGDVLRHWTQDNRNTNVPGISGDFSNSSTHTTRFLKSASYLNFTNLYAGYSFNSEKIKKLKMQSLRVYVTANNLWMIAGRRGMNPQADFYNNPGYVYGPARNIMLGLNIGI